MKKKINRFIALMLYKSTSSVVKMLNSIFFFLYVSLFKIYNGMLFNPNWVVFFIQLFISLLFWFFGVSYNNVAYASEEAAPLNNVNDTIKSSDSISFSRTLSDFYNMLHNFPAIKETIDPKYNDQILIFEKFRDNLLSHHEVGWFFDMYSNSVGFKSWASSIVSETYFNDIILLDFYLRDLFEDIIPLEIRAEIKFGKINKLALNEFFLGGTFDEFISNFCITRDGDLYKDLMLFRDQGLESSKIDDDFFKFIEVKENYFKYVNSFPNKLHAEIWAIRRLQEFEILYLKDFAFFSIFKDQMTFEHRVDFGQYTILDNINILLNKENYSRIGFGRTMESYSVFFPFELRNLMVNCQELYNLRTFCILHPDAMELLRDNFSEDVFTKLLEWRANYEPIKIEASPGLCPLPIKSIPSGGQTMGVCPVPMPLEKIETDS